MHIIRQQYSNFGFLSDFESEIFSTRGHTFFRLLGFLTDYDMWQTLPIPRQQEYTKAERESKEKT